MRNHHLFKLRLLAMLGVAVFFLGCKDEKGILGLDVQPGSDKPGLGTIDNFSLITYTEREDSLRSDETQYSLLGAYHDDVFGISVASFYSQFLLEGTNVNFGTNPVLDSIVLTLDYVKIYGDTNSMQEIQVFELTEGIEKSEEYYTHFQGSFAASPIGSKSLALRAEDSLEVLDLSYPGHLRIPLDLAFGQSILNTADSNLTDNESFLSFFPGLYITVADTNPIVNSGAIVSLDVKNGLSGIRLYYHNDENDSLEYQFIAPEGIAARIGTFSHNYNSSPDISNALNDSTLGQQNTYIQGMSGLKTMLKIPNLQSLIDSGYVANQALLYIPISANSTDKYAAPENLSLAQVDTAGTSLFVIDQFEGSSHFGGSLSGDESFYEFNITRHINQILNGSSPNYPIKILASGSVVNPNRAILGGAENGVDNIRLSITYTKP